MKVDKEFLVKNQFWLLLGGVPPLLLVAMLMLWTSVASAIQTERDAIEKSKDSLKKITDPKNQKHVDQLKNIDEKIASKKNLVWEKAWKVQQHLWTWPKELQAKMKDKYFGDPIDHFDRAEFVDNWYRNQWRDQLYLIVNPLDPKVPGGFMQFKGGWDAVVQPVRDWVRPTTDEEVWLAQEDLWVKRELLRVARDANELVGVFRGPRAPEGKPEEVLKSARGAAKEEVVDHKVFTNPYWELELVLTRNPQGRHYLRGTIKNISQRRIPLGFYLLVRMQRGLNAAAVPLAVDGDPVAVGEKVAVWHHDIKADRKDATPVDAYNPGGLFGVEQLFTWRTAPVKRIDALALGYPAHRVANRSLKPYPGFAPKTDDTAGAAPLADPMGMGGNAGSADASMMMPSGDSGGRGLTPGLGGKPSNMTPSGLRKDRYIDVTAGGPVRRMPVAVMFTIDQAHIQEVLTAFANSRLRIQTTQAHWQRSYDNLQPRGDDGAATAGQGDMPGSPPGGGRRPPPDAATDTGDGDSPGGRRMPRLPPNMMMPGTGMGSGTFGMSSLMEEEEPMNLVEITIYGIASLYERYPPKPQPGEGGTPGADGATPAPATPGM